MGKKIRADIFLFQNNYVDSREKAKNLIIAGKVKINGEKIYKPSILIDESIKPEIEIIHNKFVSRGGDKLDKAMKIFNIDVKSKIVADLGSSTGGFVDCLLQYGAKTVYAIDVGYGQLDFKLRYNPKVIVYEKTNARKLSKDMFHEKIEILTADLSFISIIKVIASLKNTFDYPIESVILIKPQFEANKKLLNKGVIKKKQHHIEILNNVINELIKLNVNPIDLTFSPIKGPKGNIEFLLHCIINSKCNNNVSIYKNIIDVVNNAYSELN